MGLLSKMFGKKKEEPHSSSAGKDRLQEEQLLEEKQDMIQGIEDLSETAIKEVMIPRIDVDFISIDTPEDELLEKIAESGHSRFPVYSDSIDNVVGILYVKELIKAFSRKESVDLEKMLKPAYFIPESVRVDSLLREFKKRHLHIAVVVDEYGGISGIVCMEDLIEEIVGDIQDEFDHEGEEIVADGDNRWICNARTNLDDLNEEIGSDFPNEEFDTLGGFVFDVFGKIPAKYEKASWKNFDFVVQDMEGHKINRVKIIKNEEVSEG